MTGAERRKEKKNYGKDLASFCRIMKRYFPDFIDWLKELKDPRKFWTYETELMLMTVIMKNVCCIDSMQQMTDEFINDVCVKDLCTVLGIPEHEFLPHYVTLNGFLSRLAHFSIPCKRIPHVVNCLYIERGVGTIGRTKKGKKEKTWPYHHWHQDAGGPEACHGRTLSLLGCLRD